MENHGDGSQAIAPRRSARWFGTFMKENFECNVGPTIGHGPDDAREGTFTRRIFHAINEGWKDETPQRCSTSSVSRTVKR